MTGRVFLQARCRVRGAVCRVVCGARAAAVMFAQCPVVAAVRGVSCGRAGLVLVCSVVVCDVTCVLLACYVLGDTRHDVHVSLCWVGLVTSCASVRRGFSCHVCVAAQRLPVADV